MHSVLGSACGSAHVSTNIIFVLILGIVVPPMCGTICVCVCVCVCVCLCVSVCLCLCVHPA
jgi:hypothetical protein